MSLSPWELNLEKLLNQAQFQAATHKGGPLLIVAGAGSGKTRTLVHRVAWLVSEGYDPSSILLLTFTRKAAFEMLSRCATLVGTRASKVAGGTFHSLANMLLRRHAHHLGYPVGFGIMDQDDSESLMGRLRSESVEAAAYKRFPQKGALLNVVSQSVNRDTSIKNVIELSFPHFENFTPIIEKLALQYREHKLKNALMDFDDLLVGLERVMREHEDVREHIAGRYSHILVDEYQDTNPVQARLTQLLGRDHLNVTAVGDDAQSIYAFRGASFRNIMDFPSIFPGTRLLKLEENYRSVEPILNLANHIISGAQERYEKELVSVRGPGVKPKLGAVVDQLDEAVFVAEQIEKAVKSGIKLNKIAVLFRASSHSFDLEIQLTKRRIPFTKYGGRKFLETAHIKDFLSFLRVAANPADGLSLRRIVSLVPGIGPKGSQDVADWVNGDRAHVLDLESSPLRGKGRDKIKGLAGLMKDLAGPGDELTERTQLVFEYYKKILPDLYPDDWPGREGDLTELMRMSENGESLTSFLADLTLDPPNSRSVGQRKSDDKPKDLTLSTIHSAKGLEWSLVFILSAVEGRFPPSYGAKTEAEVEEERRLMYVAVTRAEDELYIMMPLDSGSFYQEIPACPSRFLGGLPNDVVEIIKNGQKISPQKFWDRYLFHMPGGNMPRTSMPLSSPPVTFSDSSKRLDSVGFVPIAGHKIIHPVFGKGLVLNVVDGKARIDFELFGKKSVTIKYAKMIPQE